MRASAVFSLVLRLALIGACGFATWSAIRTARADWAASAGTLRGYEQALRIAPSDPDLLARAAVFRSDNDDAAASLDGDLRRAAQLNPVNSAVLMTLGLREELRGERGKAEEDLVRAAEVDHQFKPAWTLANFYFRANQPEKSWAMLRQTLQLDPLGFDPTPVFQLCWREAAQEGTNDSAAVASDAAKIADVIPPGAISIQYLAFLMRTHRTEAALAAWPRTLAAPEAAQSPALSGFPDFLAAAGRVPEAVKAWNELVERGIIHSGHLDPARGVSIANPDFRYPLEPRVFGWRLMDVPGVFASVAAGSLDLEISGDEAMAFQLLATNAPLRPATRYRLVWKADASSLNSPRDPGFAFQIAEQGKAATSCPPLLSTSPPACEFSTQGSNHGDTVLAAINLGYTRAQGTVRVSGTMHLLSVRLEMAQ